MTKKEKFKKQLAQIFDDNLRTKQWQNYVDYVIIGLIVISTISVFSYRLCSQFGNNILFISFYHCSFVNSA